jgi:hypothetical protein
MMARASPIPGSLSSCAKNRRIGRAQSVNPTAQEVREMEQQAINCTVSSCYYNDGARRCRAERILVQHNAATLDSTKMEIAQLGAAVATSNETLCQTYIPHGMGPRPGISRLD